MALSPPLSPWLIPFWTDGFLAVPLTNHGLFYLRAFAHAVPSVWNPHGPWIPVTPSLSPFRSQLRRHPSEQPSLSARPHQLKHPPPPNLSLCTLILLYFPWGEEEEMAQGKEEKETPQNRSVREGSSTCVSPDHCYVPSPHHMPRPGSVNRVRGAGCWLKGRRVKTSGQGERLGRLRSRVEEEALGASSQAAGVTPALSLPDCVTSGRHASLWTREFTTAIIIASLLIHV